MVPGARGMSPAAIWAGLGKWQWAVVIGVLAVLTLTLAYCSGGKAASDRARLKEAEAAAELDARADKADAAAAVDRVEDARADARQRKELEDATAGASDIDDARRRRGCAILRQQGRDTSKVAKCR
jgi:hypothetical protein